MRVGDLRFHPTHHDSSYIESHFPGGQDRAQRAAKLGYQSFEIMKDNKGTGKTELFRWDEVVRTVSVRLRVLAQTRFCVLS